MVVRPDGADSPKRGRGQNGGKKPPTPNVVTIATGTTGQVLTLPVVN